MYLIALKMLFGDKTKFLTLVIGLSFSVLLIVQQASIFCGLMLRGGSTIFDTNAPVWVMDPAVSSVTGSVNLSDSYLYRVKNVEGIEWAVPISFSIAEVRSDAGDVASVQLVGMDEQSLIGLPKTVVSGSVAQLNQPDSVIISTYNNERYGAPKVGDALELNDHRVKVVAIVEQAKSLLSPTNIYTTYSRAKEILPPRSRYLSYVLAKPVAGLSKEALAKRITQATGLKALTDWELFWLTVDFIKVETGIPINFGITIALGVIVGAVISAQTLFTFINENRRQFGTFKAIGIRDTPLVGMVVLQSLVVGLIGFGIGCGITATMGLLIPANAPIAFYTPWQVIAGTFVIIMGFCVLASILSIKQLLKLDSAMVFRS